MEMSFESWEKFITLVGSIATIGGAVASIIGTIKMCSQKNDSYQSPKKDRVNYTDQVNSELATINGQNSNELQKDSPHSNNIKSKWLICGRVFILIGALTLAGIMSWMVFFKPEPIVFVGGGSVMNYLADIAGVDVREQDNSISIALASGSSWVLLNERQHAKKESSNNSSIKTFTPICLSASKISKRVLSEYFSKMDDAIIVEVFLGYDPLVTYVSPEIKTSWGMGKYDNTIRSDSLNKKIKRIISDTSINKTTEIRIFTTNKTSGTLELYKKHLPDLDLEKMIDKDEAEIFYCNINPDNINNYYDVNGLLHDRKYILLGSQHYTTNNDGPGLSVLDTNNQCIRKQLYLYFLAEKEKKTDPNSNYYNMDKKIFRFLKKIENESANKDTAWEAIKDKNKIYFYEDKKTYPKIKTIVINPSEKEE